MATQVKFTPANNPWANVYDKVQAYKKQQARKAGSGKGSGRKAGTNGGKPGGS